MHETSDASAKGIFWFAIAFILSAILTDFILRRAFFTMRSHDRSDSQRESSRLVTPNLISKRREPPPPRLQIDPTADYQNYLKEENQILSSYAWIDEKAGIARIPIERAMELMIKHRPRGRAE